jgi:stage V sporulation protein S
MELIQVYATSPTSAVAGAITSVICEYRRAEVQAVGAKAVNQAIEALALATCYLKSDGIFVQCVPQFSKVVVNNKVKTAIKLLVEPSCSPQGVSLDTKRAELPLV